MPITFEKHLLLMQIVQDMEHLRSDIINNAKFAKNSIGSLDLNEIINIHIKANATAYLVRLDRVNAVYQDTGRRDKLNSVLAAAGFDPQEARDIYTELRSATMLLIDTTVVTDADVISLCDKITEVGGSNYLVPHDQLWG